MKQVLLISCCLCLLFSSMSVFAQSRVGSVVSEDVTERLEGIDALKKSMRDLNRQLLVLNTAYEEAKKHRGHKRDFENTKKVADAISSFTFIAGAIATYTAQEKMKVFKITALVGGLSSATSLLSLVMINMSTDQAEEIHKKVLELQLLLKATEINLNKEIKLLCASEPSNQMCR